MDKTLRVAEIFDSIQGESVYQGYRCHFIRLAGCNLTCSGYPCDTKDYQSFGAGQDMSIEEILEQLTRFDTAPILEITGGEPLLQAKNLFYLICEIMMGAEGRDYKHILIETNGTIEYTPFQKLGIYLVVDIKTPGSKERFHLGIFNWKPPQEVKFVCVDGDDIGWAAQLISGHQSWFDEVEHITISPVHGRYSLQEAAKEMITHQDIPFKLGFQLHKLINMP